MSTWNAKAPPNPNGKARWHALWRAPLLLIAAAYCASGRGAFVPAWPWLSSFEALILALAPLFVAAVASKYLAASLTVEWPWFHPMWPGLGMLGWTIVFAGQTYDVLPQTMLVTALGALLGAGACLALFFAAVRALVTPAPLAAILAMRAQMDAQERMK